MRDLLREPLWYWRRASAMSAPELLHRAGEQLKRAASRYRRFEPPPSGGRGGMLLPYPGLAAGVAELGRDPAVRERWRRLAEAAQQGRLEMLGQIWPANGGAQKWHMDPVSGRTWPDRRYCFDIPYRHDGGYGDIKYVWELNRLQYLQSVAAYAHASNDAGTAAFCVGEIESWMNANPPFLGVNWASGIELATRVVSLLTIYSILGPDAFNSSAREKLFIALAAHGYWLSRFPSWFSSANNHRIAEAAGLFMLGRLAPGLPAASEYAREGFEALSAEALRQIHPDGVNAEQSLTYGASTAEWLLVCGELGRRTGSDFPEAYWSRIRRVGYFLASITDRDGNQPRIGDDDEGHVLDYRGAPQRYESSVVAGISKALKQPLFGPERQEAHLLHALFPGVPRAAAARYGLQVFREGGYSVSRSIADGIECLLLFDHGPVGYLSIAAHGHADALAIWLHVDGAPVLVDGGTYLYHSGAMWRSHFRGSTAHSTLTIGGEDSSIVAGHFNWRHMARTHLLSTSQQRPEWHVEAEHSGYEGRFGAVHRRRVEQTAPGSFLVTDLILGRPVKGEIGFLLHPDCRVQGEGQQWEIVTPGRGKVRLRCESDLRPAVELGHETPPRGWYSPVFGARVPTVRLSFSGRFEPERRYAFSFEVVKTERSEANLTLEKAFDAQH